MCHLHKTFAVWRQFRPIVPLVHLTRKRLSQVFFVYWHSHFTYTQNQSSHFSLIVRVLTFYSILHTFLLTHSILLDRWSPLYLSMHSSFHTTKCNRALSLNSVAFPLVQFKLIRCKFYRSPGWLLCERATSRPLMVVEVLDWLSPCLDFLSRSLSCGWADTRVAVCSVVVFVVERAAVHIVSFLPQSCD